AAEAALEAPVDLAAGEADRAGQARGRSRASGRAGDFLRDAERALRRVWVDDPFGLRFLLLLRLALWLLGGGQRGREAQRPDASGRKRVEAEALTERFSAFAGQRERRLAQRCRGLADLGLALGAEDGQAALAELGADRGLLAAALHDHLAQHGALFAVGEL